MHYLGDLCGNYFCFPPRSGAKWQLKSAYFLKVTFFLEGMTLVFGERCSFAFSESDKLPVSSVHSV